MPPAGCCLHRRRPGSWSHSGVFVLITVILPPPLPPPPPPARAALSPPSRYILLLRGLALGVSRGSIRELELRGPPRHFYARWSPAPSREEAKVSGTPHVVLLLVVAPLIGEGLTNRNESRRLFGRRDGRATREEAQVDGSRRRPRFEGVWRTAPAPGFALTRRWRRRWGWGGQGTG